MNAADMHLEKRQAAFGRAEQNAKGKPSQEVSRVDEGGSPLRREYTYRSPDYRSTGGFQSTRSRRFSQMQEIVAEYQKGPKVERRGTGFNQIQLKYFA